MFIILKYVFFLPLRISSCAPHLHPQRKKLVIFTCGFIKFILQENETLHRETVYMDLDTMLLQSWSNPSIENIIM